MKNAGVVIFLTFIAVFMDGAAQPGAFAQKPGNEVSAIGVLDNAEIDGDGNPPVLGLWEEDELMYVVVQDEKGKELMGHIGRLVKVSGTVEEGEEGIPALKVKNFQIVKE